MMAALGAKALATSSAAHAFTLGRADMGGVSRDEALAHAADLLAATDLPVSGDFENGFGDTPADVADHMQDWMEVEAADGFNILPAHVPTGLQDVVDLVVPELQRRSLYRTYYEGSTLRENLGIAPAASRYA